MNDKLKHAMGGFLIAVVICLANRPDPMYGLYFVFLLSVGKEVLDAAVNMTNIVLHLFSKGKVPVSKPSLKDSVLDTLAACGSALVVSLAFKLFLPVVGSPK